MNHVTPPAHLSIGQQIDAFDDGFPYERIGSDVDLGWGDSGWIPPTPFMIVLMKELIAALVKIYGYRGHWLLREIGEENLTNPQFFDGLGVSMFLRLYDVALKALPLEDQKDMGFTQ